MQKDLENLDLDSLKEIHLQKSQLLQEALLNGYSWAEVQELRKSITNLSILIHKKNNIESETKS